MEAMLRGDDFATVTLVAGGAPTTFWQDKVEKPIKDWPGLPEGAWGAKAEEARAPPNPPSDGKGVDAACPRRVLGAGLSGRGRREGEPTS